MPARSCAVSRCPASCPPEQAHSVSRTCRYAFVQVYFIRQVRDACQAREKRKYRTLPHPGGDLPDVILNLPGASSTKEDEQSRARVH
jgi:hypothetical protein